MDRHGVWEQKQKILVILAHPDDPEFFCGASLAKWVQAGHIVDYVLLTGGEKGGEAHLSPDTIKMIRQDEQLKAANIIGVHSVRYLDKEDGGLIPDISLRREIVRLIRDYRPDIVVTCDPTLLYTSRGTINHPDHRAAGQVVLDAIFPAAGNSHYYPELLSNDNLAPHCPKEVWITQPIQPNFKWNITGFWETKLNALKEHRSQIGDPVQFEEKIRSWHTTETTIEKPEYEESFRILQFSR